MGVLSGDLSLVLWHSRTQLLCHGSWPLQEGSEVWSCEFSISKLQALIGFGRGSCLTFSTLVHELFPEASRDQSVLKSFIHSDIHTTSSG